MNGDFCLCGAQSGYPHPWVCPIPLYRASSARIKAWYEERDRLMKAPTAPLGEAWASSEEDLEGVERCIAPSGSYMLPWAIYARAFEPQHGAYAWYKISEHGSYCAAEREFIRPVVKSKNLEK